MNPVDGFRLDCPDDAGEDLMNSVEDKGSGQILCPDDSGEDLMNPVSRVQVRFSVSR